MISWDYPKRTGNLFLQGNMMSKDQEVIWNGANLKSGRSSTLKQTKRIKMINLKKLALTGCVLAIGFALVRWAMPRYTKIEMAFSEQPSDGDYIVDDLSGTTDRIKIKHGKVYHIK